jgi:CheY-like chemotaxis protein
MAYTEAASATNMETTSGASPLSQDDLHVLLVEDNLINQSLTALQLRQAGCVVHVANHGQECLEFLESSCYYREIPRISINDSAPQSPVEEKLRTPLSVILLDQKMPVMDGLTCVRKIRSMQDTGELIAHVPVIACTANARREQVGVALEAGMVCSLLSHALSTVNRLF